MNRKGQSREARRYSRMFVLFSARAERILLILIAVMVSLLVLTQLLLQIPWIRHSLVRVEQLEGELYLNSGEPG